MFVHEAERWQSCTPLTHSSISVGKAKHVIIFDNLNKTFLFLCFEVLVGIKRRTYLDLLLLILTLVGLYSGFQEIFVKLKPNLTPDKTVRRKVLFIERFYVLQIRMPD